jgi:hypothetical protein
MYSIMGVAVLIMIVEDVGEKNCYTSRPIMHYRILLGLSYSSLVVSRME